MEDLDNKLIILRSHEELAGERIPELVSEVESTFFSQPTQKKMLASLSDGYFCFSEEDIKTINKRLNYHPNFFGIHFDTSVSCLSSDISDNWYIKIDSRRAA